MSSNVLVGPDLTLKKGRQTAQVARSDERYAQTTHTSNDLMLNVDATFHSNPRV